MLERPLSPSTPDAYETLLRRDRRPHRLRPCLGCVVVPEALILMKNRLKVLRAERDWSQADLADRLDVSRQAVNAIETGKHDPSLPLAFSISRLFEMPIEEIFDDEHDGE